MTSSSSSRGTSGRLMLGGRISAATTFVRTVLRWLAQQVEHELPKLGVAGSNLCPPLRKKGLVPGGYRGEALRALVHQAELMQ